MVKKIKIHKNPKEDNKYKKNINLSLIINKTKYKLSLIKRNNTPMINTTVFFKINYNPSLQDNLQKDYYKRYLFYLKEEFNSKVISMFSNYISLSKVIPISFKNNRYFLQEFLKIIVNLLINEIDLVILTLILDNMGWIEQGSQPWIYIYYICLSVKEQTSSENTFSILLQILERNNKGFKESFLQWINNINNRKKLQQIEISKINERFKDLMKPLYLNENHIKYINYNEIVNKIIMISKQKENIPPINTNNVVNSNINININKKPLISNNKYNQLKQPTIQMLPLEPMPYQSGYFYNNKFESPSKVGKQPLLDIQPNNNSFYNDKFLDLSRNGSRNNSFFALSSFDGELYKTPSLRFNNK